MYLKYVEMKFIISLLVVFCTFSCSEIKVKENKVQHIKLDLHPNQKLYLSELSDSIEIIPLQLTDNSNLDKVLRIVYHKERIYLMNSLRFISRSLHVFDRYGSFIYKIDKRGNGPDEYVDMKDFCIDKERDELIILGCPGKLLIHDLDGNFKRKIDFDGCYYGLVSDALGNYYAISDSYEHAPNRIRFINDTTNEGFFEMSKKDFLRVNNYRLMNDFDSYKQTVYYSYPFCDTIYDITQKKSKPIFYIDYQGKNLPVSSIFKDGNDMQKIAEERRKNDDCMMKNSFAFSGNFIYVGSTDAMQKQGYVSLYSLKTGKSMSGHRIIDDVFFPNNTVVLKWANLPITLEDDCLIWLVSPSWLLRGYETYKKELTVEKWERFCKKYPNLINVCSNIHEESNPIILKMRIKEF